MKDGEVVVVTGKLNNKIKEHNSTDLILGTLVSKLSDNRVQVLLSDGTIFIGYTYEIAPIVEQTV